MISEKLKIDDTKINEQQRAYAMWAQIYDPLYVKFYESAHKMITEKAAEAGKNILEIGVGTGLTLRHYPKNTEVVGVDISFPMLKRAQEKIDKEELTAISGLTVMDAGRLGLASNVFDAVTLPFVLSLVPDPEAALNEAYRVLKPKGMIVIANRFGAEDGIKARLEQLLHPVVSKIGWASNFKFSHIKKWMDKHGHISLDSRVNGPHYTVITLQKQD